MIEAKARGQITIIDLNDAKAANMFLEANKPLTQVYSPGSGYSPSWDPSTANGSALTVTPQILISQQESPSLGLSVKWHIVGTYANGNTVEATVNGSRENTSQNFSWISSETTDASTKFGASFSNTGIMSISKNMGNFDNIVITCEGSWYDADVSTNVPLKSSITFTKRVNENNALAFARIDQDGFYFKRIGSGVTPDVITLEAVLVRGSEDDKTPADSSSFKTTWQRMGADGWVNITKSESFSDTDANGSTVTRKKWDLANNILKVYPDGVDSNETFMVTVEDTDTTSSTYQQTFRAQAGIVDMTDPFSVRINSSNGETFKNGDISGDLSCEVYLGGVRITEEDPYDISYNWSKYGVDGTHDAAFDQDTRQSKQSFTLKRSDIVRKATFFCEATIKDKVIA